MTLQYNLRLTPATGAQAILQLKTFLKTLGWTVPRSSDGLTYFPTSDGITGFGTGAGGLSNAKSWFVLRQPNIASGSWATPASSFREWIFQHAATSPDNLNWLTAYSRNVAFADGSIFAIAGNLLVDGDFFTINDGTTTKSYEFDTNSSVTGGRVAVPITGVLTAGGVAQAIVTAITGGGQNITARQSNVGISSEVSIMKNGGGALTTLTETVANATFTVSLPTATIRASASGSGFVCGGGTLATPTYGPLFPTDNTYRWNIVADNAAPYGFVGYGWINGGSSDGTGILYDPMQDTTFVAATPGPGDSDPYVCFAGYKLLSGVGVTWGPATNSSGTIASVQSPPGQTPTLGSGPYCYTHTGQSDELYGIVGLCVPSTSLPAPLVADGNNASSQNAGQNPFNGKDILIEVPWIRSTLIGAPSGIKGFSTFLKVNMSAQRTRGLLFNFTNPGDYVSVGGVALPWDQGGAFV